MYRMADKVNITLSDADFEENEGFIEDVLKALENANNGDVVSLRWDLINKEKNDILQKICIHRKQLKEMNKKLKKYRYINVSPKLKTGSYVRWINLNTPDCNIKLTSGGFVCKILFDSNHKNAEATVYVKNNRQKMIPFKTEQSIVFQKINPQEDIILQLSKYIEIE